MILLQTRTKDKAEAFVISLGGVGVYAMDPTEGNKAFRRSHGDTHTHMKSSSIQSESSWSHRAPRELPKQTPNAMTLVCGALLEMHFIQVPKATLFLLDISGYTVIEALYRESD